MAEILSFDLTMTSINIYQFFLIKFMKEMTIAKK